MSSVSDAFIEGARQAVDDWDGQDTADLFLTILERTGENAKEVLREALYRVTITAEEDES